ncbi:hypothetical protein Tco_1386368 [Tanacetum coccineum]
MDVATLITLLLEKKEEVTRHFQKIAYIKKTAWKKLQVQRMKEMNLGRKITRIPFQNRILHEERKGISAVVGSITQNLADLQDDQRLYVSIYDQPTL